MLQDKALLFLSELFEFLRKEYNSESARQCIALESLLKLAMPQQDKRPTENAMNKQKIKGKTCFIIRL